MANNTAKPATAKKTTAKKTATRKTTAKRAATTKKTAAKPAAPKKKRATRAAKSTSGEFKDRALSKAKSVATDGKAKTSDAMDSLSKMIENSASTIDDNVGAKFGDYARSAADVVSDLAKKIDSKEVDEIVEDARGFVKKSPAVAIGAAAAIGFIVARLIKSGMNDDDKA